MVSVLRLVSSFSDGSKPRMEPKCEGSLTWANRNAISLASAVAAVQWTDIKRVESGVVSRVERRTGSNTDTVISVHKQ